MATALNYLNASNCLTIEGDKILHGEVQYMPSHRFLNNETTQLFMKVADAKSLLTFCTVHRDITFTRPTISVRNSPEYRTLVRKATISPPIRDTIYLIPGEYVSEVVAEAELLRNIAATIRNLQGKSQPDEMIPAFSLDELNDLAAQKCSQVYHAPYFNNDGQIRWNIYTNNLIAALFHEFFLSLDVNPIERCEFCGHYFSRTRTSKAYCTPACKRSANSRAYRKKVSDKKGRGRKPIAKANTKKGE